MEERKIFLKKVSDALKKIDEDVLSFDESEYWMIQRPYEYIEYYAYKHMMYNTMIALPLARGLHNGTHRKSKMMKDGECYRIPYVFHCLLVCRMLVDLHVPFSKEEEDIMLAASLCHDVIEDIDLPDEGKELYTTFQLDKKVYDLVKILSKRSDFTEEEHEAYFGGIEKNKYTLLIKLSDRGHNVEDLYNMSIYKTHEYVEETKKYFFPMCSYGKENYTDLYTCIEILQDKIVSLTQVADVLIGRYEEMEQKLMVQIRGQKEENDRLRRELKKLYFEE